MFLWKINRKGSRTGWQKYTGYKMGLSFYIKPGTNLHD
ncbi:hypothetical protein B4098_0972 [Heyndrickxia coagulans]|uniref:Uncharacterized protein n=1 Tax=Heyndrickxia coagulans TaxID=1398 RepID=A0A150K867_HEYCO|nr:hypothetical protein B4098_0972 [Heyndrickxia coagulans]